MSLTFLKAQTATDYFRRGYDSHKVYSLKEALENYNASLAIDSTYYASYYNRALIRLTQGEVKLALKDAQRVVHFNPAFQEGYGLIGFIRIRQGADIGDKEVIELFRKAEGAASQNGIACVGKAVLMINRVSENEQDNTEFEAILAQLDTCANLNADFGPTYLFRSMVRVSLGDIEGAIDDVNWLVTITSESPEVLYYKGSLLRHIGRFDEALELFNQAVMGGFEGGEVYAERGMLYYTQGKSQAALTDFNHCIMQDDTAIECYLNRGLLKSTMGRKNEAIRDFSKVIELNPQHDLAWFSRGFERVKLRQKRLGCQDLIEAINLGNETAINIKSQYCRGIN